MHLFISSLHFSEILQFFYFSERQLWWQSSSYFLKTWQALKARMPYTGLFTCQPGRPKSRLESRYSLISGCILVLVGWVKKVTANNMGEYSPVDLIPKESPKAEAGQTGSSRALRALGPHPRVPVTHFHTGLWTQTRSEAICSPGSWASGWPY